MTAVSTSQFTGRRRLPVLGFGAILLAVIVGFSIAAPNFATVGNAFAMLHAMVPVTARISPRVSAARDQQGDQERCEQEPDAHSHESPPLLSNPPFAGEGREGIDPHESGRRAGGRAPRPAIEPGRGASRFRQRM